MPEKVPQVAEYELAVRYEPMTAVAGDFYDFVELPEGGLAVLVADVSGHGVPAALIASMLKMAFVSSRAHADDPAAMLTKLNEALCGRFQSHFVTAIYVVLEPKLNRMTYAGAAHPPAILRRAEGQLETIEQNGLMLGAFAFASYENAFTNFRAGDQVLLYTDGLVEAENNAGGEFGAGKLQKAIGTSTANETLENIFKELRCWTGSVAQGDDLTAVLLRAN